MTSKNLLIITHSFPDRENAFIGGIFIKDQLRCLGRSFNKVFVLCPTPYGIEVLRRARFEDYTFDNIQVFFTRYFNFPLLYFALRSLWIRLEKRAILRALRKNGLDFELIHAHFTWPSGAVAVGLRDVFGVPVVITEHGASHLHEALRTRAPHYTETWRNSDAIIRVNKADIAQLAEYNDRVYHIPNGYNPDRISRTNTVTARRALGLPVDKEIVFTLGGLNPYKGQIYLIEAMMHVCRFRNDVMCYIGGSGPLENRLRKTIRKLGLEKRVILLGHLEDATVSLWMNAMDLFVLPSLNESFGIVQLEAMACGKPVVATYNGGSEELLISEDLGYLVQPKDSTELAHKILRALENRWDERVIISYASQYTWDSIVDQIRSVYSEIAEKTNRSHRPNP